jgi:Cellulose-binding Sde182, nucleoside hydrolase-like domain
LPKLRVYFIGGPNKKWSVDTYHYIATHHPKLWIIEANATYWGWFTGGNQTGDFGNISFVAAHIACQGALGEFFAKGISFDAKTRSTVKMGDTPSVAYLLRGKPEDPSQESWGGQFVRAWERPYKVFDRFTTAEDEIEPFGIFELVLPIGDRAAGQPEARMLIENQSLTGFLDAKGAMRFRFSPKDAKVYGYTIRANILALDGKTGALTSVRPPPDAVLRPSPLFAELVDRRSSAGGGRGVARWRQNRQPLARRVPARLCRARASRLPRW